MLGNHGYLGDLFVMTEVGGRGAGGKGMMGYVMFSKEEEKYKEEENCEMGRKNIKRI